MIFTILKLALYTVINALKLNHSKSLKVERENTNVYQPIAVMEYKHINIIKVSTMLKMAPVFTNTPCTQRDDKIRHY